MANRRPLDSSHDVIASNACHAHFKSRALFLSLALISCLISINCASFGHRSVNQHEPRQWQKQPGYRLYSGSKDDANLDELLFNEFTLQQQQQQQQRQPGQLESQLNGQQLSPNYYFDSISSSRSSPAQSETEQLYQQLALARQLVESEQLATSAPSQLILDYPAVQNSESFVINEQPDYRPKLVAELLQFDDDDKKYRHLPLAGKYKPKFTDPNEPLYLPLDQAQPASSETISINYNKQDGTDGDKQVGQSNHITGTESLLEKVAGAADRDNKDNQRNFTTLLESEEEEILDKTNVDVKDGDKKETNKVASTKSPPSNADSSYGTIITQNNNQETKLNSTRSGLTSLFGEMYEKLAGYLPFLNKQANELRVAKTTGAHQSVANPGVKLDQSSVKMEAKGETTEIPDRKISARGNVNQLNTKQSVSGLLESDIENGANEDVNEHDKQTIDSKVSVVEDHNYESSDLDSSASFLAPGLFLNSELEKAKIGSIGLPENDLKTNSNQRSFKPANSESVKDSIDDEVDLSEGNKKQQVSFMRQSSLAMPFKSSDELLVESSSSNEEHPLSLLGKYIYAPESRFHDSPKSKAALDLDDEQMYTQMSHRSYSRRLHPGDDLYNSYGGLRPMYSSRTDGNSLSSLVANKTNDVYFLVMVASFCAMAMAVVLAAGLFAYRVQQNRKSTTESDYPTYGVVGPNNMNGKSGAAAFVGGYFAGIGPNSRESGSKTGSIKQLPDIYGGSDSGLATSKTGSKRTSSDQTNNGNNRSDFMANQNAARMYHYQHQKQQMIISDRASTGRHTSASDLDSEEENDDGSYTVYECPGLASAHEMEIKNPMFNEDQTP